MAKILLVGPGNVGCYLAACFKQRGDDVRAWGRSGAVELDFELLSASTATKIQTASPTAGFIESCDLVIVTVKAYQLKAAFEGLPTQNSIPVAVLCNGMVSEVLNASPYPDIRQGIVTVGITRKEQQFTVVNQNGTVAVGPIRGESRSWEKGFWTKNLPSGFAWHDEITPLVRRKWFMNTVINCLCAFYDLSHNGDLFNYKADVEQAAAEAYSLGQLLEGEWGVSQGELLKHTWELIEQTKDNTNSMVQDRRRGVRTEVDYLAGLAPSSAEFPLLTRVAETLSKTNR